MEASGNAIPNFSGRKPLISPDRDGKKFGNANIRAQSRMENKCFYVGR
jgi:hypothetical protein